MQIGILTLAVDVTTLAKRAEELGFDALWLPEHTATPVQIAPKTTTYRLHLEPDGTPQALYRSGTFADPLISLARASAVTRTIKLGTAICLIPERNPLLLAKEVTTLDHFSGGRFLFGIGAGWLDEETTIMGGDFAHRWGQTREAILAMKELWRTEAAEFHGKYYDFPPVISFPRPAQRPHPPIYVGAFAMGNVFRRVVSYGDGWMPWLATPEQIREGRATLDELARGRSRPPRDRGRGGAGAGGARGDRGLRGGGGGRRGHLDDARERSGDAARVGAARPGGAAGRPAAHAGVTRAAGASGPAAPHGSIPPGAAQPGPARWPGAGPGGTGGAAPGRRRRAGVYRAGARA